MSEKEWVAQRGYEEKEGRKKMKKKTIQMKNINRQKYKKLDLKMKCKLPNETKHSEY